MKLWLKTVIFEGGFIKTPLVGFAGWISAESIKGVLGWLSLIGSATLVLIHVYNAAMLQFCRRRYKGDCGKCPFLMTPFCSKGTKDDQSQ